MCILFLQHCCFWIIRCKVVKYFNHFSFLLPVRYVTRIGKLLQLHSFLLPLLRCWSNFSGFLLLSKNRISSHSMLTAWNWWKRCYSVYNSEKKLSRRKWKVFEKKPRQVTAHVSPTKSKKNTLNNNVSFLFFFRCRLGFYNSTVWKTVGLGHQLLCTV